MKTSEFIGKFKSSYLWLNLLAMGFIVALIVAAVWVGINFYTHHGEAIAVPNVKGKSFEEATRILENFDFYVEVSDTGYIKTLPANCVLEQSIQPNEKVKSGRIIYLTINASKSPTITLPDIIDNSSLREAMAKLRAMGFKVGMPEYVYGEKEWVYGIKVRGKNVATGDKISVEDELIIQVGNGLRDAAESVNYIDPVYSEVPEDDQSEIDDFQEVTGPIENPAAPTPPTQPTNPVEIQKKEEPTAPTSHS